VGCERKAGWLYEAANEAVLRSLDGERTREQCLPAQLAVDVDDWEEWQSEADRRKELALFNILEELDKNTQACIRKAELGEEWTTKAVVPEKMRRGMKKKVVEPPSKNRRITEFLVKKNVPMEDESLEHDPVLYVKSLEKEWRRSWRLREAKVKTAEWRCHGEHRDTVRKNCGAGGMCEDAESVSDACRDGLPKQTETNGQTNTHWGVQISRKKQRKNACKVATFLAQHSTFPEVPLANRPCENSLIYTSKDSSENISRLDTKT
jgi:hypothetical protein